MSAGKKRLRDDDARISRVQFGIFSSAEIRKMSKVQVTDAKLFCKSVGVASGLFDGRMGPVSKQTICLTCANDIQTCPGHYGHIELPISVFNIEFLNQTYRILCCVCCHCSHLLVPRDSAKYRSLAKILNPKKRLAALVAYCSKRPVCTAALVDLDNTALGVCGGRQPVYKKEDVYITYTLRDPVLDSATIRITMRKVELILKYISDEDVRFLGMDPIHSHPASTVLATLVVPPPCIRPNKVVSHRTNDTEDHLTLHLQGILKYICALSKDLGNQHISLCSTDHPINTNIKSQASLKRLTNPLHLAFQKWLHLQRAVANYQYNRGKTNPNPWGQERSSIRSRFTGPSSKRGRMRATVASKRQDHGGRAVIVGNPSLDVDEVGVPRVMCMRLTYSETVAMFNIARLARAVDNGPGRYPGATTVKRDGKVFHLKYIKTLVLRVGDEVARHLVNGDYVLFNRQPSLHRNSLMAHRVRVVPGNSFHINVAVTVCYNGDFDGDEMNLHCVLSEKSRAECSEIMAVTKNLVKDGRPIVQLLQHAALSCFLLTHNTVLLDRATVCQLLMSSNRATGDLPEPSLRVRGKKPLWSGKDLVSFCFPRGLYVTYKTLRVVAGTIVSAGPLTKDTLNNGVLFVIWKDFGEEVAAQFINGFQRMLMLYLDRVGTSINLDDCALSPRLEAAKKAIVARATRFVAELDPAAATRESDAQLALDVARDHIGDLVLRHMGPVQGSVHVQSSNGLFNIIRAGAKGNDTNMVQIGGMLGQQVNHSRGRIALPTSHFRGDPASAAWAHGFVSSSYADGMRYSEFFYHMIAGREGLVDTAVKTGETGYLQRKMATIMEDIHICADGSARQSDGAIVQYLYGGDGMDGNKLEKQMLHICTMLPLEVLETYYHVPVRDFFRERCADAHARWSSPGGHFDSFAHVEWRAEMSNLLALRDRVLRIHNTLGAPPQPIAFLAPLDFGRLANQVRYDTTQAAPADTPDTALTPFDVYHIVKLTWAHLETRIWFHSTPLLKLLFFASLACKKIAAYGLDTREGLRVFLARVGEVLERGAATANDAVGIVAAQNCTEPMTQMTLNSFHKSGQASELERSVERLRSLINGTNKLSRCRMQIPLHVGVDPVAFGNSIVSLLCKDLITSWQPGVYDTDRNRLILSLWRTRRCRGADVVCFTLFLDVAMCKRMRVAPRLLHRMLASTSCSTIVDMITHSTVASARWWLTFNIEHASAFYKTMAAAAPQNVSQHIVERVLKPTKLRGISGIDDYYIGDTAGHCVYTRGSGMLEILKHPDVLVHHVTTSNIQEIYTLLGVDAACLAIQLEWRGVMTANGVAVSDRHISLIADKMCTRGVILPMTYGGMAQDNPTIIKQASFEKAFESIANGAIHAQCDATHTAMSAVCFNSRPHGGTGLVTLVNDEYNPCIQIVLRGEMAAYQTAVQKKVSGRGMRSAAPTTTYLTVSPQSIFRPWHPKIKIA